MMLKGPQVLSGAATDIYESGVGGQLERSHCIDQDELLCLVPPVPLFVVGEALIFGGFHVRLSLASR